MQPSKIICCVLLSILVNYGNLIQAAREECTPHSQFLKKHVCRKIKIGNTERDCRDNVDDALAFTIAGRGQNAMALVDVNGQRVLKNVEINHVFFGGEDKDTRREIRFQFTNSRKNFCAITSRVFGFECYAEQRTGSTEYEWKRCRKYRGKCKASSLPGDGHLLQESIDCTKDSNGPIVGSTFL